MLNCPCHSIISVATLVKDTIFFILVYLPKRFQSQLLLKIHMKCGSALCCIGLILYCLLDPLVEYFMDSIEEIKVDKSNGHVSLLPFLSCSLISYLLAVSFPSRIFSLIHPSLIFLLQNQSENLSALQTS